MTSKESVYVVGSGNMAHMHCLAINNSRGFDSLKKILVIKDEITFNSPKNFVIKRFSEVFKEKVFDIFMLVIASGAPFQAQILSSFLKFANIRTILLEKNLAASLRELEGIAKTKKNCFVNFPLHFHNEFQYLEQFFEQTLEIEVLSKDFSLMTNSLHYLNIAKRIFGCEPRSLDILPTSDLITTKRGYAKDFYGEILVNYDLGKKLLMKSDPDLKEDILIKLKTSNDGIFNIDTNSGTILNNNILSTVSPFQFSVLGSRIYDSITTSPPHYLKLQYSIEMQSQLLKKLGSKFLGGKFEFDTKLPVA